MITTVPNSPELAHSAPPGATRDEICALACAEAFRGDGEILASPMSTIAAIGARLAKLTFEPDLVLTDGIASMIANVTPVGGRSTRGITEGWVPYRTIFDIVWWGRRHVIMGASQIDRFGNQNISCVGEWQKPKAQLLGVRGAPGNTINHTTSYFIPNHSKSVFVERVDMVSGVGYDRAALLGSRERRFHEIRRVISNLGVFDFETPDHRMRIRSIHPGVNLDEVVANTGFDLIIPEDVQTTRSPDPEQIRLMREAIDPDGLGKKELRV